jgi:hypothetical protein
MAAIDTNDRRSDVEATRAAVAEWLGVEPDGFDVETAAERLAGSTQ